MFHVVYYILSSHLFEGGLNHGHRVQGLTMGEPVQLVFLVMGLDLAETHFYGIKLGAIDGIPDRLYIQPCHFLSYISTCVHLQVVHKEK